MSKYSNKRITLDGYNFDSQAEARRYGELRLLEAAGEITGLRVHPSYLIFPPYVKGDRRVKGIEYEADFRYMENGREIAEDVKGVETEAFRLKRKLFDARYPLIELRVVQA